MHLNKNDLRPDSLGYRADVDGLRAIAVLSVIIFHINRQYLPGGYTGVDVFFVISGFLITSLLRVEILKKNFSFTNFYIRRIKRILPASFTVLGVTFICSSLILLPLDFLNFCRSLISVLTFSANIFFANENNYFSPITDEYPLLHMWSLAVEEQFYFLWPTVLLLLLRSKYATRKIISILLLASLASTCLAQIWLENPSLKQTAYYLLPSRIGELIVGALVSFWMAKHQLSPRGARLAQFIGIALLLVSFFVLSQTTKFPGLASLIPCLGTGLIIAAGATPGVVTKLLSYRPLIYIGLISFSLYLWHWPILALTRYLFSWTEIAGFKALILLVIIWIISDFSYRFIEQPFRKKKLNFKSAALYLFAMPSLLLFLGAMSSILQEGYIPRFLGPSTYSIKENVKFLDKKFCYESIHDKCTIGSIDNKPKILIFGDSHGGHYTAIFDEFGKALNFSADAYSLSNCIPILAVGFDDILTTQEKKNSKCASVIKKLSIEYVNYDVIVFAGRWVGILESSPQFSNWFRRVLSKLSMSGKNIIIMEQVPEFSQSDFNRYVRMKNSQLSFLFEKNLENVPRQTMQEDQGNTTIKNLISNIDRVTFFFYFRRRFEKGRSSNLSKSISLF